MIKQIKVLSILALILMGASLQSFATLHTGTGTIMNGSGTAIIEICKGDSVGINFRHNLNCFPNMWSIDVLNNHLMRQYTSGPAPYTVVAGSITEDFFGGDFGPLGYYALKYSPQQLVYIDTITGLRTTIGASTPTLPGHTWTGLKYDHTTGTWFASSTNISTTQLYTIDISTGVATPTVPLTTTTGASVAASIWIAIDNYGQMYTLDIVTDHIFSVNKYTGVCIDLGYCGFNANSAQDADFDPTSNILYLGAWNISPFPDLGELRWWDPNSGNGLTYSLGAYSPTNKELDAVAISGPGGSFVSWTPTTGVSDPTSPSPYLFPTTTTTYYATMSYPAVGTGTACTFTDSITIIVNAPEETLDTLINVDCYGFSTGEIVLSTTGVIPITYSWSHGASTEDISGLAGGTYYAIMTDGQGCQNSTDTFVVTEQPMLTVTLDSFDNASCFGVADGNVYISALGGTPPLNFSWNDGSSLEDLIGVVADDYAVTITDSLGCTTSHGYFTLTSPPQILLNYDSIHDVSCAGDANGGIFISTSGGTGGFSYSWSSGASTEDVATGLAGGTYDVTVEDAIGCTVVSVGITVIEPAALNTAESITDASCAGGLTSDGAINITVSGGVAPFNFNWSNGATSEDLSGLAAGSYDCTITDLNGCVFVTGSITVGGTGLVPTVDLGNDTFGCGSYTLSPVTSSGVSYLWNNGSASPTLTVNNSGSYWVEVSNGCGNAIDVINVDMYQAPYASFGYWSYDRTVSFNNLSSFDATTTYTWDFGDGTTSTTFSPLHTFFVGGTFNVCLTVTNACGSETYCDQALVFPLSIEEILGEGGSLSVFPNPATDFAQLDLNVSGNKAVRITLVDMLGNLIQTQDVEVNGSYKQIIDLTQLPAGTYGIEVSNDKAKAVKRLVVVH